MQPFFVFFFGLTREVSPRRHAVDGVEGVTSETVVQQLPIADAEAQQDAVDPLLGGRLRGENTSVIMSFVLFSERGKIKVLHLVFTFQRISTDVVV